MQQSVGVKGNSWAGALVLWLKEEILEWDVMSSNPSIIY